MALRLGDLVVCGEIFNTQRNTVHGYITLRDQEQPLALQLTGNCSPDLAGRHFRFEARPNPMRDEEDPDAAVDFSKLAWQQVGPPGTMTAAHKVKVFDCSIKEFLVRSKLNEPPPTRWVRCLYLEWFSQNGRVVIELPDPILEFVERAELEGVLMTDEEPVLDAPPDEEDAATPALGVTTVRRDADGKVDVKHEVLSAEDTEDDEHPEEDAYGLVPDDLQRMLDAQSAATDDAIRDEGDASECLRELRLLDDLIDSNADVPLCSIFETPFRLPRPEDLDDRQIQGVFSSLLAQLALCGIALDVCRHFTARDAYTLLFEKILVDERVFPQMRGTQYVHHFMTAEYCPQCEAEIEREIQEFERRRELQSSDPTPPEDMSG